MHGDILVHSNNVPSLCFGTCEEMSSNYNQKGKQTFETRNLSALPCLELFIILINLIVYEYINMVFLDTPLVYLVFDIKSKMLLLRRILSISCQFCYSVTFTLLSLDYVVQPGFDYWATEVLGRLCVANICLIGYCQQWVVLSAILHSLNSIEYPPSSSGLVFTRDRIGIKLVAE